MVTRNEVMIVSGQFAAFVINAIIFNVWGENDGVWRWMLLVAVLPAFALFFGMLKMPESPRWLTSQDRNDEALGVLKQIRSDDRAEAEMDEVHRLAEEEKEAQTGGWADLAVPWIRRLVIIGIGLGVFQQFTGINSIMYYGSQLLEDAGFSAKAAVIANTANGLFSVLGHHRRHPADEQDQPAHHAARSDSASPRSSTFWWDCPRSSSQTTTSSPTSSCCSWSSSCSACRPPSAPSSGCYWRRSSR